MKEDISCRSMATSPSVVPYSPAQPFPTPSPFSFSVASTRWSSRPSIYSFILILRFLALLFSFVSALSLVAKEPSNFSNYSELVYCFIVSILAFLSSAYHLFKGISDIAYRGVLIPDMISDYISFILDQLIGYLLISSSSVAIPVTQQMERTATLWKAAVISICISFATFLVIAICALFSGYKLCKRIMW
ncbi:Casparian strip membrane protein domain [Dillenia turbinata]|uniref:CASP-like protein n=1 Tax=Dillenia turbinata TaxID=194707 RepID=A0AAN8VHV2_9MAGN